LLTPAFRPPQAGVDFGAPQLFDLVLALRRDELEARARPCHLLCCHHA
jgi:hypothetical protein